MILSSHFTEALLLVSNRISGLLGPDIQSFSNLGMLQPQYKKAHRVLV